MVSIGVEARTTGGKELARVLRNLSAPNNQQLVKAIEQGMRREVLPRIASGVARRSGDLAKSFDLRTRKDAIELTSNVHYSRQARFSSVRPDNAVAVAHKVAARQMARVVQRAYQNHAR